MDQLKLNLKIKRKKKGLIETKKRLAEKNIIVILPLNPSLRQLVIVNIFPPKEGVGVVQLSIVVINSLMSFLKLVV